MLNRFNQLFDNHGQPVLLFAITGEVRSMNIAAQNLFAKNGDEHAAPLIALRNHLMPLVGEIKKEKHISFLYQLQTTKDELKQYQVLCNYVTDEISSILVMLTLTSAIPQLMVDDLQKGLQREMDQFVYNIAHDLKSPVVTLVGFVELLKEDCYGRLDPDTQRYLDYVIGGAKKLDIRLEALAKISRVTRANIKLVSISLTEILQQITEHLKILWSARSITFEIDVELPAVVADTGWIKELFIILLTNAIQYSPNDRTVIIEIGWRKEAEHYLFWVKDNGIGIDEKYHERIFEIFYRTKDLKQIEGTGVGLALARRIITVHEGQIYVTSKAGNGSCFYFTLPRVTGN